MTTSPLTEPTSSDYARATAFCAGLFYLVTFASSIPALALLDPVLNQADYIIEGGSNTRVLWGGLLDIVNALACIATAVVLFPVTRRHNETLALGFVTTRLLEAAIIFAGVVAIFSIVSLQGEVGGSTDQNDSLVNTGRALVVFRDWTFLLGPGLIPVFNALMLAPLLHRASLVPRTITLIGMAAAPILAISTLATVFGFHDQVSVTSAVAAIPIAAWEFSLAIWLVFKGFKNPTFRAPDGRSHQRDVDGGNE